MKRTVIAAVLPALVSVHSTALAQDDKTTEETQPEISNADFSGLDLAPASEWKLRRYNDRCRLSRNFGTGENATTLWLEQGTKEPAYNLTLIGGTVRYPYGPAVRLQFGDENEIIRSYISAKSSRGRPILMMFGVSLTQPQQYDNDKNDFMDVALSSEREAAISTLTVRTAVPRKFRLILENMGESFQRLRACGEAIHAKLTDASLPAEGGAASGPSPIGMDEWSKKIDYPRYLARSGMEGRIQILLTVKANGKVGNCFIERSNRPQLFDDSVCLSMMKIGQFEPATDAAGEPVASFYRTSVTFQLN